VHRPNRPGRSPAILEHILYRKDDLEASRHRGFEETEARAPASSPYGNRSQTQVTRTYSCFWARCLTAATVGVRESRSATRSRPGGWTDDRDRSRSWAAGPRGARAFRREIRLDRPLGVGRAG
jgi:hypothetical protein